MPLFDSHCHLPHRKYTKPTEQVVEDARIAGVTRMIAIGTSIAENEQAIRVAGSYAGVFCSAGIHIDEDKDRALDDIRRMLSGQLHASKKVVAVGECGIDIGEWENSRTVQEQIALFEMQARLAVENHLPVIIHNRNGDEQVLDILRTYAPQGLRAIAHSFSQSWEYAQRLLEYGAYLSFSGMITYKGRKGILETVEHMPLDRMLVETDAPYLPPEGFRGQPNEPKNVVAVAQKIAQVRGDSFERIAKQTYENAQAIFRIPE